MRIKLVEYKACVNVEVAYREVTVRDSLALGVTEALDKPELCLHLLLGGLKEHSDGLERWDAGDWVALGVYTVDSSSNDIANKLVAQVVYPVNDGLLDPILLSLLCRLALCNCCCKSQCLTPLLPRLQLPPLCTIERPPVLVQYLTF